MPAARICYSFRSRTEYTVGIIMSVNNVALISPATTVMAIGVRISAPSPNPRAHRQKTQNGGCSRHQDGSEVDRAGLHNRIHLLNSCCAQVVYIIDKNNCIIYHDARQHNQTKEDHNAQGNACDKRPGSDTCRAQYDSRVVPDQNEVCTFLAISRYPMAGDDSGREMVIGVPWSPPVLTARSSGISPRKGISYRLAILAAPP